MHELTSNWDLRPSGSRNGFRLMFVLVLFGAIQGVVIFLFSTVTAILHFPDYSFANNYLSDLGRKSFEHYYLFNYSVIWLGVSLIPLFLMIWITDPKQSFSAKATACFGTISAIGLIGLGATPLDRYFITHHMWLGVWLFPMFYMTMSFFYVASRSPFVGIGFVSASLVMVIAMIAYLMSVELTTYELVQKAVVVCGLIWLGYIIAYITQAGRTVLRGWAIESDEKARKEAKYISHLKFRDYRAKQK